MSCLPGKQPTVPAPYQALKERVNEFWTFVLTEDFTSAYLMTTKRYRDKKSLMMFAFSYNGMDSHVERFFIDRMEFEPENQSAHVTIRYTWNMNLQGAETRLDLIRDLTWVFRENLWWLDWEPSLDQSEGNISGA